MRSLGCRGILGLSRRWRSGGEAMRGHGIRERLEETEGGSAACSARLDASSIFSSHPYHPLQPHVTLAHKYKASTATLALASQLASRRHIHSHGNCSPRSGLNAARLCASTILCPNRPHQPLRQRPLLSLVASLPLSPLLHPFIQDAHPRPVPRWTLGVGSGYGEPQECRGGEDVLDAGRRGEDRWRRW